MDYSNDGAMGSSSDTFMASMAANESIKRDMAFQAHLLFSFAKAGKTAEIRGVLNRISAMATDGLGMTALHHAVIGNHLETCQMLLGEGISVDTPTKVDRTPLHYAAYEGHEEIVKLLLEHRCDVNRIDLLRMTPLHWAVEKRRLDIVEMLMNHGANPNAVSKFQKTPMSIAESVFPIALELLKGDQTGDGYGENIISYKIPQQDDDPEEIEEGNESDEYDNKGSLNEAMEKLDKIRGKCALHFTRIPVCVFHDNFRFRLQAGGHFHDENVARVRHFNVRHRRGGGRSLNVNHKRLTKWP